MMTPRENYLAYLNHEPSDWIPPFAIDWVNVAEEELALANRENKATRTFGDKLSFSTVTTRGAALVSDLCRPRRPGGVRSAACGGGHLWRSNPCKRLGFTRSLFREATFR